MSSTLIWATKRLPRGLSPIPCQAQDLEHSIYCHCFLKMIEYVLFPTHIATCALALLAPGSHQCASSSASPPHASPAATPSAEALSPYLISQQVANSFKTQLMSQYLPTSSVGLTLLRALRAQRLQHGAGPWSPSQVNSNLTAGVGLLHSSILRARYSARKG